MSYDSLREAIVENIRPNGNQEITGQALQDALLGIINEAEAADNLAAPQATTYTKIEVDNRVAEGLSRKADKDEVAMQMFVGFSDIVSPDATEVGYIRTSDGSLISSSGRTTITYNVHAGDVFLINGAGNQLAAAGAAIAMYDGDGVYLREYSIAADNSRNDKRMIIIPDGVSTLKISYLDFKAGVNVRKTTGTNISPVLWAKAALQEVNSQVDAIADMDNVSETPLETLRSDGGYASIFRSMGVIGGSMSTGFHSHSIGDASANMPEYSFIQFMSRTCGSNGFNFSQGGMSARSWLSNSAVGGASDLFNSNPCQMYIVQLGNNDRTIHDDDPSYTLGSLADINIGNENNNPDTFYGNLSKILAKIKSVQPRAYVFVSTYINGYGTITGSDFDYNLAIREIVNYYRHYANDEMRYYLLDYFTYGKPYSFFRSGVHENTVLGSHLVATGYLYEAKEFCTYIDWLIKKNMADFNDVAFIGTDNYNSFTISYNLAGATSSNTITSINGGWSYISTIDNATTVQIKMGGVDITNEVYDVSTGHIGIPNVWANVVISASE